jgi:hypothetical protein
MNLGLVWGHLHRSGSGPGIWVMASLAMDMTAVLFIGASTYVTGNVKDDTGSNSAPCRACYDVLLSSNSDLQDNGSFLS